MIEKLTYNDIDLVVSALPNEVRDLLEANSNLWIAGGFIRDLIMGIEPKDIDIWGSSVEALSNSSGILCDLMLKKYPTSLFATGNADTIRGNLTTIQFIKRWIFNSPEELIKSFDYSCCAAAVWYDGTTWKGICLADTLFVSDGFKSCCATKSLVYTRPMRDEDKMGSLKRLLKFMAKGWEVDDLNLARLLGRTTAGRPAEDYLADDYFYSELVKVNSTGGY